MDIQPHIIETRAAACGTQVGVLSASIFEEAYQGEQPFSREGINRFKQFCGTHRIYYYARPAEDFFAQQAVDYAARRNIPYVILESLS